MTETVRITVNRMAIRLSMKSEKVLELVNQGVFGEQLMTRTGEITVDLARFLSYQRMIKDSNREKKREENKNYRAGLSPDYRKKYYQSVGLPLVLLQQIDKFSSHRAEYIRNAVNFQLQIDEMEAAARGKTHG